MLVKISFAKLGLFHIVSESSVAAGVRRIEAVTGTGVLNVLKTQKALVAEIAENLKAQNPADAPKRANAVMNELKETRQALADAEGKLSSGKLADILKDAVTIGDVKIATKKLNNVLPDALRQMTDTAKAENDNLVTVLAAVNGEKITFCVSCGKTALSQGAHAGNLVREVAKITGGNGGGKPDAAMAGGKDAALVNEALSKVCDIVSAK